MPSSPPASPEGCESRVGPLLHGAYGRARRALARQLIRSVLDRVEPPRQSITLRRVFADHHGVEVGMHTAAGAFVAGAFPPGTTIGRYSSISWTARAVPAGRPTGAAGPFAGLEATRRLDIGHDVWLGHGAIILPDVATIGHGAVVGAGTVVAADVPPYAVVVGNPGRVVRFRFDDDRIASLLDERWWDHPLHALADDLDSFAANRSVGAAS